MKREEAIEKAARELSDWWNGREVGDMEALLNAIGDALAMPKANAEPIAWLHNTKYGIALSYSDKFWELHPNFYNGKPEPRPEAEDKP